MKSVLLKMTYNVITSAYNMLIAHASFPCTDLGTFTDICRKFHFNISLLIHSEVVCTYCLHHTRYSVHGAEICTQVFTFVWNNGVWAWWMYLHLRSFSLDKFWVVQLSPRGKISCWICAVVFNVPMVNCSAWKRDEDRLWSSTSECR